MKAIEFIAENETTVAGAVAPVVMPMSSVQRRTPLSASVDKYPNKTKKVRGNALRRFKNSISN